jgi:enamine deaminase RidA (YjgF/YER057c/UK114 family)
MDEFEHRLHALGVRMPAAPKPQGTYVPAVRTGNLVFVAGQLPMRDGKLIFTGKVGREVSLEQAQEAAGACFLNALAALAFLGIGPAQVTRVIRLGGFVQCVDGFTEQPKVINGASDLCRALFGDAGAHARLAVGVNALPLDAPVEIEALFEVVAAADPASPAAISQQAGASP